MDAARFADLGGIKACVPISEPYRQAAREWQPENTVVRLPNGVAIGGDEVVVMAGPVLRRERAADRRDGAPRARRRGRRCCAAGRSSRARRPTASRGSASRGSRWLAQARAETGLAVVTEVMDTESVDLVARYADVLQVGARNMQNFSLLAPRRARRQAGPAEAGLRRDGDRAAAGGRVPPRRGERAGDPVRARACAASTARRASSSTSPPSPWCTGSATSPSWRTRATGRGIRGKVLPMARAAVAAGADGLLDRGPSRPPSAPSPTACRASPRRSSWS